MRTPQEVGAIAKQRRLELGRTQVEVVAAARKAFDSDVISEPTYRALETGRTEASDLTLTAASRGLDWPPDALFRIRLGQDPPPDEAEQERVKAEATKRLSSQNPQRREPPGFDEILAGIERVIEGNNEVVNLVRELIEEVRRAQRSAGASGPGDQQGPPA